MSELELNVATLSTNHRRRFFTVEQANRSLVLLKRIVADVILSYRELYELQEALEAAEAGNRQTHMAFYQGRLRASVGKLQQCLDELGEMGVEIRDWSLGVVDFPAHAGEREVYLCWQFGEPRVMFWHKMQDGDEGRKPIESFPAELPLSHIA